MYGFIHLPAVCLLLSGTATGKRLAPHFSNVSEEPLPKPPSDLRRWANQKFGHETGPATSIGFRRIGNLGKGEESLLEQALQYFKTQKPGPWKISSFDSSPISQDDLWKAAWKLDWGPNSSNFTVELWIGEAQVMMRAEWVQLLLQSVVIPAENDDGLECVKFGYCWGTGYAQYLLEALPSGDLIPILTLDRAQQDQSWVGWMSRDFGAFSAGLGRFTAPLERYHFLGQWMARAYVISGLSLSPANFHSIIYESLLAGHAVTPLPMPNGYQDADIIPECEWLAAIYQSRRQHEVDFYGWQSCDEIQDPESGRYTQESCYKPLYRSKKTWTELGVRWRYMAPQGTKAEDFVPFERAREFTMLQCKSRWEQYFQAPLAAMVKGFRQVISDPTFWKQADSKALKHLVEGDSEINVPRMSEAIEFEGKWTDAQKQVLLDTLHDLSKKNKGLPPSKNALNKLLRFFTGSSKEPVGGFQQLKFQLDTDADDTDTYGSRPCPKLRGRKEEKELLIAAKCLTNSSVLTQSIQRITNLLPGPAVARLTRLRTLARWSFPEKDFDFAGVTVTVNRTGDASVFEQTRHFFWETKPEDWRSSWESRKFKISFGGEVGIDEGGLTKEWLHLVLESVVMREKNEDQGGLKCLKFGECSRTEAPQFLLEALPSGNLIPILSFERGSDDDFWSSWMSGDFGAFAVGPGLQKLSALERFIFLGRWMARAYIISSVGHSPASFHSVIYESIVAGRAVAPEPAPNAYQDEDIIPECEWLAGIYGLRRPHELGTYGWQSCDEIQDPESSRYTQDSCYKPLCRSKEMWEYLYTEWGSLAPQGIKADDLVPFDRAREYTAMKCKNKWGQDFQAPVVELVKGFREVVSDAAFWKEVDKWDLQYMVEGDSEVDVAGLIEASHFKGDWTREQKQVLTDSLFDLAKKGKGVPPFQNTLNKLLRFFTGSFKPPPAGFSLFRKPVTFQLVVNDRCAPLVGKTCFDMLLVPAGCLTNTSTLEDMIKESVASEGFYLA